MKLGHRLKGHKGHCGLVSIKILDSVLNVKALIGTSKQEKVLVGALVGLYRGLLRDYENQRMDR